MSFLSQRKQNSKKGIIFLKIFALLLVLSMSGVVRATDQDNLRGWAWSENIGWISFNCFNDHDGDGVPESHCASDNPAYNSDYGVNMDEFNGNISGYAWSENMGWIDFDPSPPYPTYPDWSACVDFPGAGQACDGVGDYETSGWARALTYGGSDGWINMQYLTPPCPGGGCIIPPPPPPYGPVFNSTTEEFEGWAWSDTIGWISFNCENQSSCGSSDYKVYYTNATPTAAMHCEVVDCGSGSGCACNGTWETFNGGDVDFTVRNDSTDPDGSNHITSSTWSIIDNSDGSIDFETTCYAPSALCDFTIPSGPGGLSAGNYTVQLVVEDIRGLSSDTSHTITVYQEVVADFMCSVGDDDNWIPCDDPSLNNIVKGQTVYVGDLSTNINHSSPSGKAAGIISRTWEEDGTEIPGSSDQATTSVVLQSASTNITLQVTDDLGRVDSQTYSLGTVPSIPRYREVSPGG